MSPGTRALLVASLLLVAGLAAVEAKRVGDDRLKPESQATCWECHAVIQNDCPPLQTFAGLLPGDGVGAAPIEQFDLTVQAQNAWCSDLYSVRINLDLTNAPSLGFASGVPPVKELLPGAIEVDMQRAAEPQRSAPVVVDIPAGETRMDVVLRPDAGTTGSDLTLLVYSPGMDVNGAPLQTVNDGAQGAEERFTVETRERFLELGYGQWTFVAEARLVPAGTGVVVPTPSGTVPFELEVDAISESTGDRIGSVSGASPAAPVKEGQSLPLTFKLVVLAEPLPDERLGLSVDVWPHYTHKAANDPREDDDENVTVGAEPIPVRAEGGRAIIRSDAAPSTRIAVPQNGPTMTTVSEAVGYATAFLLVSSITTGGMFGKASRRGLNQVFGTAKRRVAFHNFLSYGILLAAIVHTVLFIVEAAYHWSLGLIWGGAAVLALLGLGLTGAIQVSLIRKWGYAGWRWTHYGLALAAIVFTVVHVLLDGAHFIDVQNSLGWQDPLEDRIA